MANSLFSSSKSGRSAVGVGGRGIGTSTLSSNRKGLDTFSKVQAYQYNQIILLHQIQQLPQRMYD